MLVLFTDFGGGSPYVGLMKQAIVPYAPDVPVIDLYHDLVPFDSQTAAYLLAAYAVEFSADSVFIGVVDPGVGGPRDGLIVQADGRYFVGPDNGLFDRIAARATTLRAWRIFWRASRVSATFHGRDIFAPVAAMLAAGTSSPDDLGDPCEFAVREWPDDLARVVCADRYGNLITGIRACNLGPAAPSIQGRRLGAAETFTDVAPGDAFFYENSSGLLEIAVNQGSAAVQFGLGPGDVIEIEGEPVTEIRVR